ncbi:hypothetical protein EYC84_002299 [Monilinia fructicola]|uniref:GPI2-domain-containing protein n=1 Tax=Monilinia fructicola TaxID=38448 RepID=A0A5M9JKZ5_MONFR|nr:hypothetical protein EYC84_002299 [Monilinia fructicola]
MVPPLAPQSAPPLNRSSTVPNITSARIIPHERSHLAPEDAIFQASPPRIPSAAVNQLRMTNGDAGRLRSRGRQNDRTKTSNRRRKATWKKLLWVKQSYPDNYTDQDTFLEHLQRNPRLQPYDFWPLVADSTVIVQHVCSVIIFVVSFVGIYQEHVSPVSVVGWGSIATFLVLASRLPSTGQVFSLTLFSIEVFGLFPVFRRYTRLHSLRGHLILTLLLVFGAGGGVGLVLPQSGRSAWDWKSGLIGVVLGTLITGLAMGGCSWWLIGLQKYKNEIHGPWDPARPVIRRAWDDY